MMHLCIMLYTYWMPLSSNSITKFTTDTSIHPMYSQNFTSCKISTAWYFTENRKSLHFPKYTLTPLTFIAIPTISTIHRGCHSICQTPLYLDTEPISLPLINNVLLTKLL